MIESLITHERGIKIALIQTLQMVGYSAVITFILGLALGITLFSLSKQYLYRNGFLYQLLSFTLNSLRSVPFLIFIFVLIPVNRFLFKTSFGVISALLPLSLVSISIFSRFIEQALRNVDVKIVERSIAMGATKTQIIKYFLLPSIMEDLVLSFTNTCISLLAYSTVMGVIGAGGLGDYAFRYGYQEYDYNLMYVVIIIFILIVLIIQSIGYYIAKFFTLNKERKMKKILLALLAFVTLVGCTTTEKKVEKPAEKKVIKVAAHTSPMTDMLELVKEDLSKEGYTLELVKVSDNVQANVALNNKEVDANFFQHKLFMESFNKGNNGNLVVVQTVYDALVSYYSKSIKKIEETPENATVAIPSDPTNMTRALRLLASTGLITLKDPNSYSQTLETISSNPKNLQFTPIGLLNLNEAYQEKDLIFNYPAYAAKINLSPQTNGLVLEKGNDLTFAVSVVAREDNKDSDAIKALKKVITSEKIKSFINEKLKGHAKIAF